MGVSRQPALCGSNTKRCLSRTTYGRARQSCRGSPSLATSWSVSGGRGGSRIDQTQHGFLLGKEETDGRRGVHPEEQPARQLARGEVGKVTRKRKQNTGKSQFLRPSAGCTCDAAPRPRTPNGRPTGGDGRPARSLSGLIRNGSTDPTDWHSSSS